MAYNPTFTFYFRVQSTGYLTDEVLEARGDQISKGESGMPTSIRAMVFTATH